MPVELADISRQPHGMLAAMWYVVHTKRHKERAAQLHLEQTGIGTYLPLMRQWPPPVVGPVVTPLFPGYLFVQGAMPHDSQRVTHTPGVLGFVSIAGEAASLDGSLIALLRSREDANGIIRSDPLPPGLEVRIVRGPLRGLIAVVQQRLTAQQRVRVLLDILQRPTRVDLPERWVRQA
jgi:transcriptional antiterminator RfaH